MRKHLVGCIALAGTLTLAGGASAQICAGNPNGAIGAFVGAQAGSHDGETDFGAEGGLRVPGGLGFSAGLNIHQGEDGADDVTEYRAGVAMETASLGLMIGPRVSACPQVQVRYASVDDLGSVTSIPVGFGIGTSLSAGIGPSVHGYVIPQVVFTRFNSDNDLLDDESETDFGFRTGAIVGFGTMYLGGEIEHVFQDDADPRFGIRAGIRL
jgi:hypothetical protein